MLIAAIALFAAVGQQPGEPSKPELALIDARLGPCAADFTVKDVNGAPLYAATVHVRIRYGFLGLKRMDLEVGTNSDGKARVTGLPGKAKPLTYDVSKADKKVTLEQNLSTNCQATYAISLK